MSDDKLVEIAFLLYEGKKLGCDKLSEVFSSIEEKDETLGRYLEEKLSADAFRAMYASFLESCSEEELKEAILAPFNEDREKTPESVVSLADKILDIAEGETVYDLFCGTGSFFLSSAPNHENSNYRGIDIALSKYVIAEIRNIVSGSKVELSVGNVMDLPDQGIKADKIFAGIPFGLQPSRSPMMKAYVESRENQFPSISKGNGEWAFISAINEMINKQGKAIVVAGMRTLFAGQNEETRKFFFEHGYLEAVIALPSSLMPSINIPLAVIVLSRDNKTVRVIDATKEFETTRRINVLTEENINHIYDAYLHGTENSKDIDGDALEHANYNLTPSVYTSESLEVLDGKPFEEVIQSVQRGANISARMLDSIVSKDPTPYKYMQISDIQEGEISKELTYITGIDKKYEKNCVEDQDLIISKIASQGSTVKVAVANVLAGEQIVAGGNLYIIRVDRDKIDPYYLKAFLESSVGDILLKRAATGTVIPSISVANLKNITVPVPSMEEQKKFVEEYLGTLDEIRVLQNRINQAKTKLHGLFDQNRKEG